MIQKTTANYFCKEVSAITKIEEKNETVLEIVSAFVKWEDAGHTARIP